MIYFAHTLSDTTEDHWQGLRDHLLAVGAGARSRADKFGAGVWGEAAGLLHDIGKYSNEYQARLRGDPARVDHSTAGSQIARQHYGVAGNLIAGPVAGHHAGLANGTGTGERTPLSVRLTSTVPDYSAWDGEIALPALTLPHLTPHPTAGRDRIGLQLATFSRMIFGCLVDADWTDTSAFYGTSARDGSNPPSMSVLGAAMTSFVDGLQSSAAPTRLNRLRAGILATARARARKAPGIFSMTVPTGGGKTLASLAFGLDHAALHGHDRVIYVAPYCTIVDQTADVFRRALRPHEGAILEQHSGVREPPSRAQRQTADAWNAPVIVSTAVQFFESLFSDRPGRCRKLHNISRSVIILDEAQTMPVAFLRPCVAILDELARNYGTTIILCTATQPALVERENSERSFVGGLVGVREIAPAPSRLYRGLRRVTIRNVGQLTDGQVADQMIATQQGLCIVNTRRHARALFNRLRENEGACHLSTMMCPAHRRRDLTAIRKRLSENLPVRLVSTSLIEAGVDIDFSRVWRAMAGLDQIAQAAGRCNREGRRPASECIVTVFEAEIDEPRYMRPAADATREVLRLHTDPLALRTIEAYFRRLYWSHQVGKDGLDAHAILPRLNARASTLLFPHEDIAHDFQLIDDAGEGVIIPWNAEARRLIAALKTSEQRSHLVGLLDRYTVGVYARDFEALKRSGAIVPATADEQFWTLADPSTYDDATGLTLED